MLQFRDRDHGAGPQARALSLPWLWATGEQDNKKKGREMTPFTASQYLGFDTATRAVRRATRLRRLTFRRRDLPWSRPRGA